VLVTCGLLLTATMPAVARAVGRPRPTQTSADFCGGSSYARKASRVTSTDITSVGITYFAGRSRSGDDAHLASALTNEVATQLLSARVRSSDGRANAEHLLSVKLSDGGGFAEVDLSMTGAVFREGDLLRTNVRVTRTSDGTIIWSGTKVRPIMDLPILARLVAQEVAVRIGARLTAPSPRAVSQKSSDIYELYLRGTFLRSRYAPDDLLQAISYFKDAIALDASSTGLRTAREQAELRLVAWGGDASSVERALLTRGLVRRVLDRDRDEAERLVEEADAEMREGELVHACQLLNTAIDGDPRSSPAYALRSLVRARGGDIRESYGDAEVVSQLGRPRWGAALRAFVANRSGDTTNARLQARRMIAEARTMRGSIGFWDARFMAIALVETGYLDEAQGVLRRIDARDPRLSWLRNDPLLLPRPSVIRRPRRAG
jgi:TolB-like protein